jgi:hypothetical protein
MDIPNPDSGHLQYQLEFQGRVVDAFSRINADRRISDEAKHALLTYLQAAAASSDEAENLVTRFTMANEELRQSDCDVRRFAYAKAIGESIIKHAAQI